MPKRSVQRDAARFCPMSLIKSDCRRKANLPDGDTMVDAS